MPPTMTDDTAQPSERTPGDLIGDRRRTLAKLREELGVEGYGGRVDGLVTLAAARAAYDEAADNAHKENPSGGDSRPRVTVAGRVMQSRIMGNLIFLSLRDASDDGLQVAVSKKLVTPEVFKLAKLVDLSDIVVASGALAKTKTGEITVWAEGNDGLQLACKSLAPPPDKYHGLSDPELRYRKRYVDFYANPDAMRLQQRRIQIVDEIRQYFRGRGFLEVETPMLQPIHGGAAARPFVTHHNALDMQLYLRIAPELYLKRMLVGGFHKVFEINRNFRNEGISPRHNPEFTMLEAYEAFGSWETMADLVEDMICTVAMNVLGTLEISHEDTKGTKKTINLTRPWRRVRMTDIVAEKTGWTFNQQPMTPEQIDALRSANPGKDLKLAGSPAEQLVEIYEKLVEPTLIDPTFVTHVPSVVIPLARENKDDPFFADVYELAINGTEISPGYSELNDPDVQAKHFRHQVGDAAEQQQVDEDFLEALRVGMPPAGGMGLGIDRLVMMLTGAESIRDVIAFPLMRPQNRTETADERG